MSQPNPLEAIAPEADSAGRRQESKGQYALCLPFAVSESCYSYQPQQNKENDVITDWLLRITDS